MTGIIPLSRESVFYYMDEVFAIVFARSNALPLLRTNRPGSVIR